VVTQVKRNAVVLIIRTSILLGIAVMQLRADLTLLTPEEEAFVPVNDFFVTFRLSGINEQVRRVKMFFDNEELSTGLRITAATISFIPDNNFIKRPDISGPHTVTVILYGSYRIELERKVIRFYLYESETLSDEDKLVMIKKGESLQGVKIEKVVNTGKIYAGIDYQRYQNSGTFSGNIDAYGNGYKGNWFYNYNLSLNTQEEKRHQTLQRFRVATGYTKSLLLSIGDNWPSYNTYILNGQRLRGVELNLKTPKEYTNLDFVIGKTRKAIDPYIILRKNALDSAIGSDTTDGAYSRKMWATRLHFGTGRIFKLGLELLKAKDDSSSIRQRFRIDTVHHQNSLGVILDTVIKKTVLGETPKDNIVAGADICVNLWKRRISLFSNIAYSVFTNNILGGAATEEEIRKAAGKNVSLIMKPKDIEHIIIVNTSTVPLPIPSDSTQRVNMGAIVNASLWDAGLRFHLPLSTVQELFEFKYFFIGPNFHSLGNEYLSTNKKGWQLTNELRFFSGKIFTKGDFKYSTDDLLSVKAVPTRKIFFNFLTSLMWNSNLPYITLLYITTNEHTPSIQNALIPSQDNEYNQIGAIITYTRGFTKTTQTAAISYNYTKYDSKIFFNNTLNRYSLSGNNGVLTITTGYNELSIQTRASIAGFLSTGNYSVNRISPSAGITWNIRPNTMYAQADFGFEHINDVASDAQNYWSIKSSFTYDISNRHSLYAQAGLNRQLKKDYIDPNFQITYEFHY
jgi:hypothetical protein